MKKRHPVGGKEWVQMTADFATKTTEARIQWDNIIFQSTLGGITGQSIIIYPPKNNVLQNEGLRQI